MSSSRYADAQDALRMSISTGLFSYLLRRCYPGFHKHMCGHECFKAWWAHLSLTGWYTPLGFTARKVYRISAENPWYATLSYCEKLRNHLLLA